MRKDGTFIAEEDRDLVNLVTQAQGLGYRNRDLETFLKERFIAQGLDPESEMKRVEAISAALHSPQKTRLTLPGQSDKSKNSG